MIDSRDTKLNEIDGNETDDICWSDDEHYIYRDERASCLVNILGNIKNQ